MRSGWLRGSCAPSNFVTFDSRNLRWRSRSGPCFRIEFGAESARRRVRLVGLNKADDLSAFGRGRFTLTGFGLRTVHELPLHDASARRVERLKRFDVRNVERDDRVRSVTCLQLSGKQHGDELRVIGARCGNTGQLLERPA